MYGVSVEVYVKFIRAAPQRFFVKNRHQRQPALFVSLSVDSSDLCACTATLTIFWRANNWHNVKHFTREFLNGV
jgi:hypothetical protein